MSVLVLDEPSFSEKHLSCLFALLPHPVIASEQHINERLKSNVPICFLTGEFGPFLCVAVMDPSPLVC